VGLLLSLSGGDGRLWLRAIPKTVNHSSPDPIMKFTRFATVLTLSGLLLVPRAHALFGVGDIVFDPTAALDLYNMYQQAQQEYQTLGNILNVNTSQLKTLGDLSVSLGTTANLAAFPRGITPAQLSVMVQAQPGNAGISLGTVNSFLNPSGVFDAFLGQTTADWTKMVASPLSYFGGTLQVRAGVQIGGNLGMTGDQAAYSQWVAAMTPAQQQTNSASIALAGSNIMLNAYFQQAAQQRAVTASFNAKIGADQQNAASATTVNQSMASQNAQTTTTNELLLNMANQQQAHHDTQVSTAAAQNEILNDQVSQEQLNGAVAHAVR
jgi:hypothetical protein